MAIKTGELKVADPARELVSISLEGVPLPWAQPYLEGVMIEGGDARGSFLVRAAGGGYAIRPQVPLTLSPFSSVKRRQSSPAQRGVDRERIG